MACFSGYGSTSSFSCDAFGGLSSGFNSWLNYGLGASFSFGNNFPHSSLNGFFGNCDYGQASFGLDGFGYFGFGNGFDLSCFNYNTGSSSSLEAFGSNTLLNSNFQLSGFNAASTIPSIDCSSFQSFDFGKTSLSQVQLPQPKLSLPKAAVAPAFSQVPAAAFPTFSAPATFPKFSFPSRLDFGKAAQLPQPSLSSSNALAPLPTFSKFPIQRAVTAAPLVAPAAGSTAIPQFDCSYLLQSPFKFQAQVSAKAPTALPQAPAQSTQQPLQLQPATFPQFQFPTQQIATQQIATQQFPTFQLQQPAQNLLAAAANPAFCQYPFALVHTPALAAAPALTKTKSGKEAKPAKSLAEQAKSLKEVTRTIKELPTARTIKELANVPVVDEKTRNLKLIEGIMMACNGSQRTRSLARKDGSLDLSDVLDFYEWLREKKRRINLAKLLD